MTEPTKPVTAPQREPDTQPPTGPESKTEHCDLCGAELSGGRCSRYQCDNY